jgi:N-acetyl-anhydromuramyl-L-alanine amidase AmpD
MAELHRVHEQDDPGPRFHWRLRRAKTAGPWTEASVTGFSRHLTTLAFSRTRLDERLFARLVDHPDH